MRPNYLVNNIKHAPTAKSKHYNCVQETVQRGVFISDDRTVYSRMLTNETYFDLY